MDIKKNEKGKTIIKLSKEEWLSIGKTAEWNDNFIDRYNIEDENGEKINDLNSISTKCNQMCHSICTALKVNIEDATQQVKDFLNDDDLMETGNINKYVQRLIKSIKEISVEENYLESIQNVLYKNGDEEYSDILDENLNEEFDEEEIYEEDEEDEESQEIGEDEEFGEEDDYSLGEEYLDPSLEGLRAGENVLNNDPYIKYKEDDWSAVKPSDPMEEEYPVMSNTLNKLIKNKTKKSSNYINRIERKFFRLA
jgi:hypothetical protein